MRSIAIRLLLICCTFSSALITPLHIRSRLPNKHNVVSISLSAADRRDRDGKTSVASQAALIAGTTIGGGFLALPTATAPCGAIPAAVGLILVWIFLLSGALSLSNAIFMLKRNTTHQQSISLFSLVRDCFGNTAGILAGLMFLLLIKVTLIAQLSKIGVLLKAAFPIFNRQIWTSTFSLLVFGFCIFSTKKKTETVNNVMTATMLTSFAFLILLAGWSGWSVDGLMRADYKSLLPSLSKSKPWAIPIFIQLLIYNEVVPLVASRLNDEDKVRKAIVYGSLTPLSMCLVWSFVVLGIVPYDPLLVDYGVVYDPLNKLGDIVLSKGSLIGKAFLASVNTLAGSAIITTVIGSILASAQYFDDVITAIIEQWRHTNDNNNQKMSILRKLTTYTLAVAPSTAIALLGSSQLYYRATSFAGEFPCTLLYGLLPPLCNLRLRQLYKMNQRNQVSGYHFVQMLLALISCTMLLVNVITR